MNDHPLMKPAGLFSLAPHAAASASAADAPTREEPKDSPYLKPMQPLSAMPRRKAPEAEDADFSFEPDGMAAFDAFADCGEEEPEEEEEDEDAMDTARMPVPVSVPLTDIW